MGKIVHEIHENVMEKILGFYDENPKLALSKQELQDKFRLSSGAVEALVTFLDMTGYFKVFEDYLAKANFVRISDLVEAAEFYQQIGKPVLRIIKEIPGIL